MQLKIFPEILPEHYPVELLTVNVEIAVHPNRDPRHEILRAVHDYECRFGVRPDADATIYGTELGMLLANERVNFALMYSAKGSELATLAQFLGLRRIVHMPELSVSDHAR